MIQKLPAGYSPEPYKPQLPDGMMYSQSPIRTPINDPSWGTIGRNGQAAIPATSGAFGGGGQSYNRPYQGFDMSGFLTGSTGYGGMPSGGLIGAPVSMGPSGPLSYDQWRTQYRNQRGDNIDPTTQSDYGDYNSYVGNYQNANMPMGQRLFQDLQSAYSEGRAANEQRYNDILNGTESGNSVPLPNGMKDTPKNRAAVYKSNPEFRNQVDRANAATGGYTDRYERNMAYLDGQGEQEKKDIGKRFNADDSRITASMAARGLLNSTLTSNMSRGVAKDRENALSKVNERLQMQKFQADSQLSKDRLDFMERREDPTISPLDYTNLIMQLGQSGYGGGGGYGGAAMPIGYNVATSDYGVARPSGGFNSPSAYSWK